MPRKRALSDAGPLAPASPQPATSSLAARIPPATLSSAVRALLADAAAHERKRATRARGRADALMHPDNFVSLVVTFAQAPFKPKLRPSAIPLAHALYKEGEDEICLFVKDPQRLVKNHLAAHGTGGVTRVMGVEKLRKRYKTHEARRELLGMYDLFLVDNRVAPMMPNLLGNAFLDAKRMPLSVDMRKNVVNGIRKAVTAAAFCPRQGTSTAIKVGRGEWEEGKVENNVRAAVEGIVKKMGWDAIQSLNVKTNKSPALPIYVALPAESKPYKRGSEAAGVELASAPQQRTSKRQKRDAPDSRVDRNMSSPMDVRGADEKDLLHEDLVFDEGVPGDAAKSDSSLGTTDKTAVVDGQVEESEGQDSEESEIDSEAEPANSAKKGNRKGRSKAQPKPDRSLSAEEKSRADQVSESEDEPELVERPSDKVAQAEVVASPPSRRITRAQTPDPEDVPPPTPMRRSLRVSRQNEIAAPAKTLVAKATAKATATPKRSVRKGRKAVTNDEAGVAGVGAQKSARKTRATPAASARKPPKASVVYKTMRTPATVGKSRVSRKA